MVSERIYKEIDQDEYPMVAAGTFHLKGMEEDMLVYKVRSLVPNQLK